MDDHTINTKANDQSWHATALEYASSSDYFSGKLKEANERIEELEFAIEHHEAQSNVYRKGYEMFYDKELWMTTQ